MLRSKRAWSLRANEENMTDSNEISLGLQNHGITSLLEASWSVKDTSVMVKMRSPIFEYLWPSLHGYDIGLAPMALAMLPGGTVGSVSLKTKN